MSSLKEYRFKNFKFHLIPKSEFHVDRPLTANGHGLACNEDYLYMYESEHHLYVDTDEEFFDTAVGSLRRYNFITGRWERVKCKNLSIDFDFSSILLSGNLVIVHGLIYNSTSRCYYQTCIGNLSHENQPDGVEFEEIISTNGIPKRGYGQPVVINGRYIYSVNGISNYEHEMDVYRLDLSTKKWELLFEARGLHPRPRKTHHHEIAYYNNNLYMFGGAREIIPNDHTYLNTFQIIHVFDLSSNKWNYKKTSPDLQSSSHQYPENRYRFGWAQCVTQPNHVYMSGGASKRTIFSDVWRLDLITLQWCNLNSCKLLEPTFYHSCTITPSGRLYYYNGEVRRIIENQSTIHQTENVYYTWLRVPLLKDMCWDAMLYYFKDQMCESSIEDLQNLGLPLEYYKSIIKSRSRRS